MAEERLKDLEDIKLYSLTEIEEIVGLTAQTLKRHIKSGKLDAVKIGNRWKVTKKNLEEYINSNK